MTQEVILSTQNDFTPASLKDFLNKVIHKKKSGKAFTYQDIQQYMMRGRLPEEYGGFFIKEKIKTKYMTIVTVKGLRKKYGSQKYSSI